MSAIRLKGYRALEISFTGRLAPGTKIQLEHDPPFLHSLLQALLFSYPF